jgi:CRISPR/Cas system-associated exonuclease Cas4 (RecB family)
MANLSEFSKKYISAIYKVYEDRPSRKSRRLGGSLIGQKCGRRVWYSFRHFKQEKFSGRMLRLFETGHTQEDKIIGALKAAGHTITGTGHDQIELTACNGHFVDKPDGIIDGKRVLEIKTMSEKKFKDFLRSGPPREHFIQMQMHGYLSGFKQCLYICENKNTSELGEYMVDIEKDTAEAILDRAERIISSPFPPAKIANSKAWFDCKYCPFIEICHGEEQPEKNCRTCQFSEPIKNGLWKCNKKNIDIQDTDEYPDCEDYLKIKG